MRLAVQIVGAALGADVHQSADGMADARVIRGRLYLEFGDRGLRRNEANARGRPLRLSIRNTVEREFVVIGARAVGSELRVLIDRK